MNKDQHLIARIKSGDKKALDEVYLRYRKEFLLYSNRFSLSEEDVQDVYQDSVIALYENICRGKLETLEGTLKTYLFAIGKYKMYNLTAQKSQLLSTDASDWEYAEEEELFPVELEEARQVKVRKAYAGLGKKCKEVLRLFYYEGFSLDEIKTHLKYTSKDVLKSQKSRCVKHLKKLVSTYE